MENNNSMMMQHNMCFTVIHNGVTAMYKLA
jgi:hypothetical protein